MCWTTPYTRKKTKTNKVLCFLFCLSPSFFLCMVSSNTYCVVFFVLFVSVFCLVYGVVQHILCMCWTPPYTRKKTRTNKLKNTTQYVLDDTIHKKKEGDKQTKKHNTICVGRHIVLCLLFCLSSSFVLCMVSSNTYCVVFFVLFVSVFCLVCGGVQHILCCVFWFVCLRLFS
jgi:hypothetical protein